MLCPACHHPNDGSARFCEQCGQPLELRCPACNHQLRPEARFCSQCGQSLTPLAVSLPRAAVPDTPSPHPLSLDDKLDQLQRYLPAHLSDKILATRGRLAGERKLVTVLFADVAGYSALSEQLGEEAMFAVMDKLYELFIHEVHRYEGTVNELTGDGIVAFFGAPLAVEQAPQRAVRAALALQHEIQRFSAEFAHQHNHHLHVRVGINTGPVIVGTVGNNLRMDYKAVGHTVNLAARMEQSAAPGSIHITEHTYKLVAGYFDCEDVGVLPLKGLTTKVRGYRVTGERGVRARIEVAREQGFTRLVGRQRELALLRQCFSLAQGGRGQAVSIIGDAGLGKSRLLYEFRQALASHDYTWLDGRCHPYGTALAYGPIVEWLKQYCHIDTSDGAEAMRHKVHHSLAQLSPPLATMAPYLLHLLAAGVEGELPAGLSPEAVKHRTFEALNGLVGESAARRPLVLTLEDLHWVDPTTAEYLAFLLDHLAGARILLLCTYRPDFASLWSRKSYHSVITLQPLGPQESYQVLTALLGTLHIQDELATLVLAKAEGVPFFLEELVKSLRETGAIEEYAGQWRLKPGDIAIPVPDTVEEVLTARIDRLPEGAKSLLQLGAVIGREFGWELLREVSGLPEREFTTHLTALTDAELLYLRGLPPQTTYLFKHAFTQEAAYRSLLTTQRQELHHRVAVTLEALFPDRLEEHSGQLAYHYVEAAQDQEVDKAIEYAVRAGERNMSLPAYTEAVRFYQMALDMLPRQTPLNEQQHCTLLLALGEAQRKAGDLVQAQDTFQRAADSARQLGSAEHLARAALEFEQTTYRGWLPMAPAVRLLQEALQQLQETDSALRARTLGSLSRAILFTGAQQTAIEHAQQAIEVARRVGDAGVLAFNLGSLLNAPWGPEETEERLTCATEMLQLARTAGNSELVSEAHSRRLVYLLELGDIAGGGCGS